VIFDYLHQLGVILYSSLFVNPLTKLHKSFDILHQIAIPLYPFVSRCEFLTVRIRIRIRRIRMFLGLLDPDPDSKKNLDSYIYSL
jgi:hypothetical protein